MLDLTLGFVDYISIQYGGFTEDNTISVINTNNDIVENSIVLFDECRKYHLSS